MNVAPPPASEVLQARLIDLPGNPEGKRQITLLECDAQAPFPVQRIYWLHDLKDGEVRGHHAHYRLQQLLVAASGTFVVHLDDGHTRRDFLLDSPTRALFVPAGLWRTIECRGDHAVLLVMASSHFDESDYIRDYNAFLAHAAGKPADLDPAPPRP